jgi:geranylgeranyl diphosphate synthase type I
MVPRFARPELEAPLTRVTRRVDDALVGLRPYGRSALWGQAITATLSLSRATTHLLRAQLVLLGNLAGGGPGEGAEPERLATGLELLHLFMLVHDDVMDDASLRRGQPTLRVALLAADHALGVREARDLAIVVGNLISVEAFRCLLPGPAASAGVKAAGELVLDACCRAGAGQFHDLLGLRGLDDEEALRRELSDKAASHAFVAPFAAGLLLGRPDADTAPAIAWGTHLGLAFQGVDDLADLLGSSASTGKDGLHDLLEGRASLPLFLLRRHAEGDDREFLDGLAGRHVIDIGERAHVDRLVRRCGVVEASVAWVRAEIGAAARVREAAGLGGAASEGMAAIERGLLAFLDRLAD